MTEAQKIFFEEKDKLEYEMAKYEHPQTFYDTLLYLCAVAEYLFYLTDKTDFKPKKGFSKLKIKGALLAKAYDMQCIEPINDEALHMNMNTITDHLLTYYTLKHKTA